MCKKKPCEEACKPVNLVDLNGNFLMVCGIFMRKNPSVYGYDLRVRLINGQEVNIAYASPEERNLPEVLELLVSLILKGEKTIDMRVHYKHNPSNFGYYGSTVLPLDSPLET